MKMNPLFSAMGLATAVFAAPVLAEVKWDMANEYQESSIHGQAQKVFTDTAMEASGGSIVITNHFGGSIGYKSKEHFDAVGDGALPIANTSMGQVAGIEPIFLLSSLPATIRFCFMRPHGRQLVFGQRKRSHQRILWLA